MALTKVTEAVLFAIASIASNTATYGSAVDVSTYYGCDVRIRMGRGTGSAFTTAPEIRLQGTYKTSPTANDWVTLAAFRPDVGASIGSQAVSGTEAAGQTTITLAAITNFGVGDYIFFHNTTLANSEWAHILSAAGSDIVIEEGLVNAQTGATVRDQAEMYHVQLDLTSIQKLRLVVDGHSSGQAVIVEAGMGAVSAL